MSFISSPLFNQYAQGAGTWATRPTAAPVASRYFATDIGPNGTLFSWDGTYWRPANGQALVYGAFGTISTPLATLTGNGTEQVFTLPELCLLPAGLLSPGSRLDVSAQMYKDGATHSGSAYGFLADTPAPASLTAVDFWFGNSINSASPSMLKTAAPLLIGNGEWLESQAITLWVPGSSSTVQPIYTDANVNIEDRYIGFGVGSNFTSGAIRLYGISVILSAGF